MSNDEFSSVEWLHHEFERIDKEFHIGTYEYNYAKNLALKISKAMHKEEITQAWKKGDGQFDNVAEKMSLEYYAEKFGGNRE